MVFRRSFLMLVALVFGLIIKTEVPESRDCPFSTQVTGQIDKSNNSLVYYISCHNTISKECLANTHDRIVFKSRPHAREAFEAIDYLLFDTCSIGPVTCIFIESHWGENSKSAQFYGNCYDVLGTGNAASRMYH